MKAKDLAHLYKSYVRPGGLYGAGVYFHFLSDSASAKLKCENYNAAMCDGAPRGAPAAPTRREAGLPNLHTVAEGEGALLFHKFNDLHPAPHLSTLTTPVGRPRLKFRGKSEFRQDWRSVSSRRLSRLPEDVNEAALWHGIRDDNETLDFELYIQEVNINRIHRRATNGQPLNFNAHRTRDEAVQLHQLRLNRAQWLQAAAHRFGRSDSSVCPHCQLSDEDTEHYLTASMAGQEEREECFGPQQVTVAVLQEAPEAVI